MCAPTENCDKPKTTSYYTSPYFTLPSSLGGDCYPTSPHSWEMWFVLWEPDLVCFKKFSFCHWISPTMYHSEFVRVCHRIYFGIWQLPFPQNSTKLLRLFSIFPNFLDLLSLWSIFLNLAFKKGGNGVPRFPLFPTMQYCSILCNIICQGSEITSSLSKILLLSSGSRAVSDEGKWNYKAVPGVPSKTGMGNKHPRNWDVSSIFSPFSSPMFPFFSQSGCWGPT